MRVTTYYPWEDRHDAYLTSYVLDASDQIRVGVKKPAVVVCPGANTCGSWTVSGGSYLCGRAGWNCACVPAVGADGSDLAGYCLESEMKHEKKQTDKGTSAKQSAEVLKYKIKGV